MVEVGGWGLEVKENFRGSTFEFALRNINKSLHIRELGKNTYSLNKYVRSI